VASLNSPLDTIDDPQRLESLLSEPTPQVIQTLAALDGDLLILGVAGKMGPTLALMAKRAFDAAGLKRQVIGVARFSEPSLQQSLERLGIRTLRCDLLDEAALAKLPDAPSIVYMAGMKFGSTNKEPLTWAMNAFLPGMVCRRFPRSRIAAFGTGNVYGLVPLSCGGSVESDVPNPLGDYAMSCLGRERIFQHFSQSQGTPVSILRLNYACELRYGVLVDLARKIWADEPVNLAMGHFNVIWQGDANAMALASLAHAASPAFIVNLAGPELLSVRRVCQQLARLLDKEVRFEGVESGDALLNNGQLGHRLYGYPRIGVDQLLNWVAHWTKTGGASLGKPTHFEARSGKF
jgi:nucleoside-diphosphate-sugar epimerase